MRHAGGQRKRYKDLRVSLKACDINTTGWEALAMDTRPKWRKLCYGAVEHENRRTDALDISHAARKARTSTNTSTTASTSHTCL